MHLSKNKLFTILLWLIISYPAFGKGPKVFFSYALFYAPGKGPYIETNLSVIGHSVKFLLNKNGKYQSSVRVGLKLMQDSTLKFQDNYLLKSPEITDTLQTNFNFLDQQRISAANGNYRLEITITDNNSKHSPILSSHSIAIRFPSDSLFFSDIEQADSVYSTGTPGPFSKSGYDVIPYVSSYYPKEKKNLRFYAELYQAKKILDKEPLLIRYYLLNANNNQALTEFNGFFKTEPKDVIVVLKDFPIGTLESGNYKLVLEARDKSNRILATKRIFFQRNNPREHKELDDSTLAAMDINETFVRRFNNKDSLIGLVHSLRPIANEIEKDFIDRSAQSDLTELKRFMYIFWYRRNKTYPSKGWEDYSQRLRYVNEQFRSGRTNGYDTDRGRVYLQYGPPNTIASSPSDPNALPYEIWHYYKLKNQSNRKFVFYNPLLSSNDFQLIHSDAVGEVSDPNWKQRIQEGKGGQGIGNRVDDNLENPH